MTLPVTTETVNFVYYGDLEDFVQKKYELEDRFEITDTPHDSYHKCTVQAGNIDLDEVNNMDEEISTGNRLYVNSYHLGTLMELLFHKGWIEPGVYIISVSW